MEEQLMKKVFAVSSIVCLAALAMMALFVYGRDHLGPLELMMQQEVRAGSTEATEPSKAYLGIPLPTGTTEADVSVENCYMNQSMVVTVRHATVDFYEGKVLNGNSEHIQDVYYDADAQSVQIHVMLDELCEYKMKCTQQELQLTFLPVHEVYDKVMIIDVGHGGTSSGTISYGISEKDVALSVVEKLKALLDKTDIRVYYTRLSDIDVTQEDRVRIAELSGADLYLSIHVNADAESHVTTGILTQYSRGTAGAELSNQKLAETIQKAVTAATAADDRGTAEDIGGIALLQDLEIPAVMLETGYMTNRQEALLLASAPYQEKLAEGIYAGIQKTYQQLGKTVNQVTEDE